MVTCRVIGVILIDFQRHPILAQKYYEMCSVASIDILRSIRLYVCGAAIKAGVPLLSHHHHQFLHPRRLQRSYKDYLQTVRILLPPQ